MATIDETSRRGTVSALKLSGTLIVGGFLFNLVVTMAWHPAGAEDDHSEIFAEYAASDGWVLTHFGQFLGVALALAGLFVLCRILGDRERVERLARLGMGALIATATAFAILQAIDGITLKQAVDAWSEASGSQEVIRFADAETVRWTEWGLQSFFRVLLGMSLALVGAVIVVSRSLPAWLGWLAGLAGLLSVAIGIDVGYAGLESGFQDAVGVVFQAALLIFAIGVLAAGWRSRDQATTQPAP
jgi:hypothetical protein